MRSLSDRLKESTRGGTTGSLGVTVEKSADETSSTDPFRKLKDRAQAALFERLGSRLYDASLNQSQLQSFVLQELTSVLEQEQTALTVKERQELVAEISDDVLGYGPIEPFLNDPTVTEIMVNSTDLIYVEREGHLFQTEARYLSVSHLRQVIERIVGQVGRRIDESSPMVDARLADGSRVNAIVPPLAVDGPALTIRKFTKNAFHMNDLVRIGSVSEGAVEFLDACVMGRLNILVSGGTGTGKTTLLNALSAFIPDHDRIVTIEDAVELRLDQQHVVRLESRPPNIENKGQVSIRDLVRNALRMRPDRIVVGEVRGGEALDMLQAMNTGHEGSMSTLHANAPRDALARLETMVLMSGVDLPVRAIRDQVSSALDLIVQIERMRDGTRRITQIVEVNGLEGEVITMSEIFVFDYSAGFDDLGRFAGTLVPTGIRPSFSKRLQDLGIALPMGVELA
jgi:pilus assembly protein CpaF